MFFRRKPQITDIQYEPKDWLQDTFDPFERRWQCPDYRALFKINYWSGKTGLPEKILEDKKVLQGYFRAKAVEAGGGLIYANVIPLKGLTVIKTIFKVPQDQMMRYLGAYIIPFKVHSFGLKIIAEETESLKLREMMVAAEYFDGQMIPNTVEEKIKAAWLQDPYDVNYPQGSLMSVAEKLEYDVRFPDHPLTKVRIWMQELEENLNFHPRMYKLRKF